MLRWMTHLVVAAGLWGVAALMAIENVVLPMPSELIMPLAGFVSARAKMSLIGVIVAGTVGSVVGALPVYYLARVLGETKVKAWLRRHGRWLFIGRRDLNRPTRWFDEHGWAAVAVGQLVPGVRGLISLPAGYAKMNVLLFALANFVGTLVWCAVLAVLGHELGTHFQIVHQILGPIGWGVLALVVGAGVAWFVRRRRRAASGR